jgi:hypothetical protein
MSHSNKRRRTVILRARVTPEEKRAIDEKAKSAGGMSALFRAAVLGYKPPPSRTDREVANQMLTSIQEFSPELHIQGKNVNQIAHVLNAGRPPERMMNLIETCLNDWREVIADVKEIRHLCVRALGLERERRKTPKPGDTA